MGALIGISSLLESLHVTVLSACNKLRNTFMASVLENWYGAIRAHTSSRQIAVKDLRGLTTQRGVTPPTRTVGSSVRRLQKETYWFYVTGF